MLVFFLLLKGLLRSVPSLLLMVGAQQSLQTLLQNGSDGFQLGCKAWCALHLADYQAIEICV